MSSDILNSLEINNENISLADGFDCEAIGDELELYFGNRIIRAPECRELPEAFMMYSKAEKLAKDIKLDKGVRYNVIVSGGFIFGDFIEAFIIENNAKCLRMMLSTLSMNENNVDSLANLLRGGYIEQLDLVVSDHFYSHERRGLLPYIYQELDYENRFQLATAGCHTKICMIETLGGKYIVIHGSANLRSSSNVEQFVVEENKELFDFWYSYHKRIVDKYKTIKKSLRGKELWQVVAEAEEPVAVVEEEVLQEVGEKNSQIGVRQHKERRSKKI